MCDGFEAALVWCTGALPANPHPTPPPPTHPKATHTITNSMVYVCGVLMCCTSVVVILHASVQFWLGMCHWTGVQERKTPLLQLGRFVGLISCCIQSSNWDMSVVLRA